LVGETRVTLADTARATAIGVRFGADVMLEIGPSEIGEGILLERADMGERWPLDLWHSSPGPGCSISGGGDAAVHYVEHLMAALWARGVTDCLVRVDGREVPLFDGSVVPLLEMIDAAGVVETDTPIDPLVCGEAITVSDDGRAACALPGSPLSYAYALRYRHRLIGRQFANFQPTRDDFDTTLAPARTFITSEEAEEAQAAGLLAAGSEENAIVVYPDHLSEEPALENAFARHKLVDMIGDLYLIGRPLEGRFFGFYSGHQQNHELAHALVQWCESLE
jgi:UDP-3-O-[3-hydroxymyristoyl] N-acetylglucosamine deacetylase